MIEQPKWDDDALAWRKYAGQLRQEIGRLKRQMDGVRVVKVRARVAEDRVSGARGRADRWEANFESLMAAKRRDGAMLDRVAVLLDEGDVPAAVDVLAERRRRINARSRA